METTHGVDYSELDDEWQVDEEATVFTSRLVEARDYQRLVFNEPFRDGSISAELTIRSTKKLEDGAEPKVGALIFRFQSPRNYYFAGIGGFGGKFFIGKMADGQGQALVTAGRSATIKKGHPYRLQVRSVGNQIALLHNGITQLTVLDDQFTAGPWGLQSWRTAVEFRKLSVETVRPTCFVIMPFSPDFDDIYRVIRETAERHGFDCVRAGQRYLSGPIMEDVKDQIAKADLIIADFTGKNANVFFEAGYASALRKPLIQIAQSVADLPFDVRHLRTFAYSTAILGDRKLSHNLSEAIRAATGFEPKPSAVPA
jgi:hypothetical protein